MDFYENISVVNVFLFACANGNGLTKFENTFFSLFFLETRPKHCIICYNLTQKVMFQRLVYINGYRKELYDIYKIRIVIMNNFYNCIRGVSLSYVSEKR